MEKLLSIIVPTYNMEALLKSDLQSLVLGESLLSKIEVIVVNDGSKDRSSEIAHEFATEYLESFRVIDKVNGNYGSCINAGLKDATGKYVRIMDADDSFDTQVLTDFVRELETVDADIVFNDYAKIYTSGRIKDYTFDLPAHKVISIEDAIGNKALKELQLPSLTYKKSVFAGLDYHQTEGISYTDMEWCFSPVTNVRTVHYIPGRLYLYAMGREGQTMNPEVFKRGIEHRVQCIINMLKCEAGLHLNDFYKTYLDSQVLRHIVNVYYFYLIDFPDADRTMLEKLDTTLGQLNGEVYRQSGRFIYRKRINYHYVDEWRKRRYKRVPLRIRLYEKILDFIGSHHARMLGVNNEKN